MRSFANIVALLFALLVCAFAQNTDTASYDATVYVTSTVYRVNTVTMSGSSYAAANQTSTMSATGYPTGNVTVKPTASATKVSPPVSTFTGAASSLSANTFIAALAAGVAYLAL